MNAARKSSIPFAPPRQEFEQHSPRRPKPRTSFPMGDAVQAVVHLELTVQSFLMLRGTEICEVLVNRLKLIPPSETAQLLAGRTTKCDLGGSESALSLLRTTGASCRK